MSTSENQNEFNRREFLKSGSLATLMTVLGATQVIGQDQPAAATPESKLPKVKCAIIGLGAWGREILATLSPLPQADLVAICDTYPPSLHRSGRAAPNAKQIADYKEILDDKDIQAVIVATPTHQHKDIVLAALKAGKHVYCEAPLANTVEDAREIAKAAKTSGKQYFQAGLQLRSDPQRHFLLPFIRSGALGKTVMARAQSHNKQSWRFTSPNPEHEKDLNWRLDEAISPGLLGEIGIHQLDQAGWFLNAQPTAVNGFGGVTFWNDGRKVPDTVQAIVEYPGSVNMMYDCTIANSFDSNYEVYYGSFAAVMLRDDKAWMFKEVDSPLLGWEVYARKDSFYKETGIALVANATKLSAQGEKATDQSNLSSPLHYALEAFLRNTYEVGAAVEDFVSVFGGDDPAALAEQLKKVHLLPAAGCQEGYEATVLGLKAHEAVMSHQRIELKPDWFKVS